MAGSNTASTCSPTSSRPSRAAAGSTGWVYGLLASHQWLIACLAREAQDEVWHDRDALATGSYAPVGQAVAVDGGYRLSGAGSFCSGCDNAQWQFLGGMIPQPDGAAKPGFFSCAAPTAPSTTTGTRWGSPAPAARPSSRATCSFPTHRTVAFAALSDASAPGMLAHPNPLYRQSFLAVLPIAIVSPVLGMAEGALADFLAMAGMRTTRGAVAGGNRRMAELTTVQMRVAEASALIDAARLLMARDLAEALASATRGEPISIGVRLRNRRDQAFCVRLLVQAIDALFLAAGGQGLFLDQPLQRTWRDAHAAASHISLNWDSDRQHVRTVPARPRAEGTVLNRTRCA